MRDPALVSKIRKLLRLGAEPESGIEGELAKLRARELMERHRIEVSIDDTLRLVMPGVTGHFWKENLLLVLARARRCKMRQSTQDDVTTILVGERPDVEAVFSLFSLLTTMLVVKCEVEWKNFLASRRIEGEYEDGYEDEYDDDNDLVTDDSADFLHPDVKSAWRQVQLDNASRSLVSKLQRKLPQPKEEPKSQPMPGAIRRETDLNEKKPVIGLAERLEKAVKIIGMERAGALYQAALSSGMTAGDTTEIPNNTLAIAERSVIPGAPRVTWHERVQASL